jgi:hypothetical protein
MQLTYLEEFDGEPDGALQGPTFIMRFSRAMDELQITEDRERIRRIGNYLSPDSPAEEWYASTGGVSASWSAFETQFKARFPGIQKAKKTSAELQREMLELELKVDELDKTELYGGVEVETYKIHAKKLLDLAKRAKIDTGTASIVFIRDRLPEVIKDKVDESHTNWPSFCAAIEAVNKAYIRDGVRKHREREAKDGLVNSRLSRVERSRPETSISAITAQLGRVNLNSQQATQTSQSAPQPMQLQAVGNRQGGPRQPGVTSEEEKALVRANMLKYPHHPGTVEGRTAYFEQLRTWKATHGENAPINAHTPFPLRPGTAPACSGECYMCGMQGHMGGACTATGAAKIPPQEGRWRALCGRCLGRNRRDQAASVNHVAQVGEFAWAGYGSYDGDDQGNGEGPLV